MDSRELFAREFAPTHHHIAAGTTLFAEGDAPQGLWALEAGQCMLSSNGEPLGKAQPHQLLDFEAVLGGTVHRQRAIAQTDCEFLCWQVQWDNPQWAQVVGQALAQTLLTVDTRRAELELPVGAMQLNGELHPGPFVFRNTEMTVAFCDATLDFARPMLPAGLTLFRPPTRQHDSLFLAIARFKRAHSEHNPTIHFSYTETTCFVPVRYGRHLGIYPLYIFPSTYEPIFLGREIYGFPKRLGHTVIGEEKASLTVDGEPWFTLHYGANTTIANEARLVRALSDWVGIMGHVTATAFQLGEVLRHTLQLPAHRRVEVYNHKRIPAVTSTHAKPVYDVDCLTKAVFGVLGWHHVTRLDNPRLEIEGKVLGEANLSLREAYHTRLDMRLSVGRTVRDYRQPAPIEVVTEDTQELE